MYKVLSISELRELSLDELKTEYERLSRVYARRMYELNKNYGETFNDLYGERLTEKEIADKFLNDAYQQEYDRYLRAYENLAYKYGGDDAFTSKQINAKIGFAQKKFPGLSVKDAVKAAVREGQLSKEVKRGYAELGWDDLDTDDISDLTRRLTAVDPMANASELARKERDEFNSAGEYRVYLLEELKKHLEEEREAFLRYNS